MPLSIQKLIEAAELEEARLQRGEIFDDEILVKYECHDRETFNSLEFHLKRITPKVNRFYWRPEGGFGWDSHVTPALLIIGTIAIVVGKGLLDGFLKEFGADGAKALKETLKTLFERERSQFVTIFPKGAPVASGL